MQKYVFIRNHIQKRVVHNIHPNVLGQVVFVQPYHTVFLQIPVFIGVPKAIAAVPALNGPKISMRVKVYCIYLRQRYNTCLKQPFCRPFNAPLGIVMPPAHHDGYFFMLGY